MIAIDLNQPWAADGAYSGGSKEEHPALLRLMTRKHGERRKGELFQLVE